MTILDELADAARLRVEEARRSLPLEVLRQAAEAMPKGDAPFRKALSGPGLAFICECKKASPSKGLIAQSYPYLTIAQAYEAAGADVISVLTEPTRFLGSEEQLREIASAVKLPCLRKDFTVDAYMIYEAKTLGAAAVLLIVSILDEKQLMDDLALCRELGLSALVEAHKEAEIETALRAGAEIIGVALRSYKAGGYRSGKRPHAGLRRLCFRRKEQAICTARDRGQAAGAPEPGNPGGRRVC